MQFVIVPRAYFPRCDGHDAADGGEPVCALLVAQQVEVGRRRDRPRAPLVRRRLAGRRLATVVLVLRKQREVSNENL